MSTGTLSVGVDVGGTNIKFGLVDQSGTVISHGRKKTNVAGGSDAIIADIAAGIKSLLGSNSVGLEQLCSIGLGIPGTTDPRTGVVEFAPNLFWKNVSIVDAIRRFFEIPAFATQDTRAAGWAEYLVGAGRGMSSVASITLGTGISCGMVFDGRIFHGAMNSAGEIGHQIVEIDGNPCNCGRHGCLEAHAAGLAIVRAAKQNIPDICDLLGKDASQIEVHDVYWLAEQGNIAARKITDAVVRYVGMALVNLIDTNSPEIIALSGGISNAPRELLLDPLIEFVQNRAYPCVSRRVCICRSPLGDDAPMIGAALLYREPRSQDRPNAAVTSVMP